MAPHNIEEYIVKELAKDSSNASLIRGYLEKLDRDNLIQLFDDFLDKESRRREIRIPVSIFKNRELSSLELIVKFLKQEAKLTNSQIATLLGRSQQVCWTTYDNACKKSPAALEIEFCDHDVPVGVLRDPALSILEAIVSYLYSKGMTYREIAVMLNRDDRTIWTVHHRALKKRIK